MRSSVERADPSWVHGRDQDPRQRQLAGARVILLGCGSIGGPLALLLAQAGVGHVTPVDPQVLVAANIGRHALGARYLGRFKAAGLADEIQGRLPHVEATPRNCSWEDLPADLDIFGEADLVVSAMGSWVAEGALNAAHRASGRTTPVLYAWTEANAAAGHAVLVGGTGGCLQCGLNALGAPKLAVTAWSSGKGLRQESACGAVFQPYGPVELNHIVSMIGDLALDVLLGVAADGEHRVWTMGQRRLRGTGGEWSAQWRASGLTSPSGGGLFELSWPADADCPECGRKAAAA